MSKIFISYRREDSAYAVGHIDARLREQFGQDHVFIDVDDMPLGVDFRAHLDAAVSQCDVLLAVIGDRWLSVENKDGRRRLDDPRDFVKIEIESALNRDIPVIPVLVDVSTMPTEEQLPESLKSLAFRQALPIRPGADLHNDINRLTRGLIRHLQATEPATRAVETQGAAGSAIDDSKDTDYDALQDFRHDLLTADSAPALTRLRYAVEEYLVQNADSPDGRVLLDSIVKAERQQQAIDEPTVQSGKAPKSALARWLFTWRGLVFATVAAVGVVAGVLLIPVMTPGPALPPVGEQSNEDSKTITITAEGKVPITQDFIAPAMVSIPAGSFVMGSEDGFDDEKPVHVVRVQAFEMARYELTWAEWEACEAAAGCREIKRPWEVFGNIPESERTTHPVVNVAVGDVDDYLTWINETTGLVYRLPSEAEWEYAARAGSDSNYAWGTQIGNARANCDGCGSQWDGQSTAPVGSFNANAFGLYDMHGNVWEWVADCWHASYEGGPTAGSAWVDDCTGDSRRPFRGGSWGVRPENLRVAKRNWSYTRFANGNVGFRLARTLP